MRGNLPVRELERQNEWEENKGLRKAPKIK